VRRLWIYLAVTFGITWPLWWMLARQIPPGSSPLATGGATALYVLGGLGPTLAAFVAVALTPQQGTLREYAARLIRWRVNPGWYAAALLGPALLACVLERLTLWMHPLPAQSLAPLAQVFTLFPLMIVGGGLEELGWRGVAQPLLQRRWPLLWACILVGIVWALWHLPLFFLHGVTQYGANFLPFAVDVLANALLLGWLYANTGSILLCVLFHAASNTSTAMGLALPAGAPHALWLGARLGLGVLLVLFTPRPAGAGRAQGAGAGA